MSKGLKSLKPANSTQQALFAHNGQMIAALAAAILLQADNTLSSKDVKQGWHLLFDGKTMNGWHNFNATGIRAGWTVKDGVMTAADPDNSGDIVTNDKYDWFELSLDFNMAKGQNSGVMFHCADSGEAMWHSGPEVQIYDHKFEPGVQSTGFLYELYDSKVDAAKPAGQWNHMHLMISPKKCWTEINGVRYYEFVLGSDDFWARVKKSKFSAFPEFAKLTKGTIGIQGDHGVVSFKNVKIRTIKA